MKINQYGEVLLNEDDIIRGLYTEKIKDLSTVNVEDGSLIHRFNQNIDKNADHLKKMSEYIAPSCSIDEFDRIRQSQWLISAAYENFDVSQWLIDQCKTDVELKRVKEELILYAQHDMIPVLVCLKYLVDHMRKQDIVWGIGRGSSVSSYCLYLIGIHKIDSIKYDLDIREFLKGEENDQENI